MSDDLTFIDRLPGRVDQIQERRKLIVELERENMRQALTHFHAYGDKAIQHAKALARMSQDITDELKDLEATGFSAAMVARLIRDETTKQK